MKVLIIRFSSIGDIVLTSPVVRCIKRQIPASELHYLTKQSYASMLTANPYISQIISLQDNISDVVKQLQEEKYDVIVDLHNNLRTALIKWRLSGIKTSFHKLNIEKWLMVNFKWNKLPDLHIVDRYLNAVEQWGIINDGGGLDYFIPEQDEVETSELPESHQNGYIAFAIGGKFATKKLPLEKLISICRKLKFPVILIGGPEDTDDGLRIQAAVGKKVYNACGLFRINQSASIIRNAESVITHDTGMMHIAAAFNKKIISIWGNTVPEFGMYPYFAAENSNGSEIIQVLDLACRPCSKIGFGKCPKGHFRCMKDINEEDIIRAL